MDNTSIEHIRIFLNKCNIHFDNFQQLDGLLVPREIFLSTETYKNVQKEIDQLKNIFSSSYMTSLQTNATKQQKWPLLNLVRQILKNTNYRMVPIRKSDGYTKDGIKKFKRFFKIEKLKKISKRSTSPDPDDNSNEIIITDCSSANIESQQTQQEQSSSHN